MGYTVAGRYTNSHELIARLYLRHKDMIGDEKWNLLLVTSPTTAVRRALTQTDLARRRHSRVSVIKSPKIDQRRTEHFC
jgi:hypothetical protein